MLLDLSYYKDYSQDNIDSELDNDANFHMWYLTKYGEVFKTWDDGKYDYVIDILEDYYGDISDYHFMVINTYSSQYTVYKLNG